MKDWKEVWPERVGPLGRVKQNLLPEQKLEIFIYRAKQIHGDKYDYSKSVYKKNADKVSICCPEHGIFNQAAGSHINGSGCPKCAISRTTKTTQEFIAEASIVHQGKYTYSNTKYTRAQDKLKIDCVEHGVFEQVAANHLKGQGCPRCALENKPRETTQEFIEKALLTHGNRYSYENTVYTGVMDKLIITCKEHGSFSQTANQHLSGRGCPSCAGKTFGILYLVNYIGKIYKIGITNNLNKRMGELKFSAPEEYSLRVIGSWEVKNTRETEQALLNKYTNKPILDKKFDGYTELRILTEQEVAEICSFLETI